MTNPASNNFTPQNKNLLQTTKFLLTFSRIPNTQYFCQEVNLPGVSLDEMNIPTPFVDLHAPGNKISYDTLDISFIINEDLTAWTDVHDWIRAMTFPENFDDYSNLKNLSPLIQTKKQPQYSDGSLQILTALNNTKITVDFINLFPISLSGINFYSTDESTTTITAKASFRFSYFKISRKT